MFKFILMFAIVCAMGYYEVPPVGIALVLAFFAIGDVADLERQVNKLWARLGDVDIDGIKSDITRVESDISDLKKNIANDLPSALARLDSLEAEMRLRRPKSSAEV